MSHDLQKIPKEKWKVALARKRVLAPLAERSRVSQRAIENAAKKLRLGRAMTFRLLSRYRKDRRTSALLPGSPGRKAGSRALDLKQEEVISAAIKPFYLRPERPPLAALHRELIVSCRKAGIPPPSYKAVGRRVSEFNPRTILTKRLGAKVSAQRLKPVKAGLQTQEPLELVQIDHTLVDVIVVDEITRKPIGRPWITLAMDVFSRMVLGFHLDLYPPGTTSVALTLAMSVLPKNTFLKEQELDLVWPAQGLPKAIHLDNAREFKSYALKRGCQEYGIAVKYRPAGRPHFGGHIERLIGTVMGEVHLLPGTTFSSVAQRGAYDSAGRAVMTVRDLERWLTLQIAGIYHRSHHRGINAKPLDVWNHATKNSSSLRMPKDPQQFLIDFLPYEQRMIRRDGIRVFNIFYWSDSLTTLIQARRKRHVVHYNPRDLAQVYVKDQHGEIISVPYKTRSNFPVTLEENNWATEQLRAQGSEVNETHLFEAIEMRRQLVEEARKKTSRARRASQKTAYALKSKNVGASASTEPQEPEDPEVPVKPFPVEIIG